MNRMEEYRRLLTELEATPPALEYTLQRAKARRRHGLWKKGLGIPAGSLDEQIEGSVGLCHFVAHGR